MASNKEVIEQFLNVLAEEIRTALPKVTGATASSIEVQAYETGGVILGPRWIGVFQDGRKPGTMPPVDRLTEWFRAKGIRTRNKRGQFITYEQSAWATAIKMKKEGNALYRALHGKQHYGTPTRIEFNKILSTTRIDSVLRVFAGRYQTIIEGELLKLAKQ